MALTPITEDELKPMTSGRSKTNVRVLDRDRSLVSLAGFDFDIHRAPPENQLAGLFALPQFYPNNLSI
jgi:hypothetical protein